MRWIRAHTRLLIIGAIILLLLIVMVTSFLNKSKATWVSNVMGTGIGAVEGAMSRIGNGVAESFFGFFYSGDIIRENEDLKEQISQLNRKIVSIQLDIAEIQEMKDLKNALNYKGITSDYTYLTCDVISMDNSSLFNLFNINAGTQEGISVGSAVLSGDGLIGRVFSTGDHTAKVMSVIDENNSVSFRVFRDVKLLGVLSGNGKGGLIGYMLDANAAVIEGDILITSGLGTYPKGIIIGRVTKAYWENDQLLKALTIEPSAQFKSLQKVMVVTPIN